MHTQLNQPLVSIVLANYNGERFLVEQLNSILAESYKNIEIIAVDGVFFAYTHSERNCIYSEGAACSYYSHDWIWKIIKKMREYSESNYPINNGLVSANVLIRKNNSTMSILMDAWWSAYCHGIKRDQFSWKFNIPIHYLGINNFTYFKILGHSEKRTRSIKITLRKYINREIAFLIPYHVLFSIPSKI